MFFKKNNDNETPKWCLYCEKYEYSLQYLYEFEVELETAAHPSWEIYLFSGTERMWTLSYFYSLTFCTKKTKNNDKTHLTAILFTASAGERLTEQNKQAHLVL